MLDAYDTMRLEVARNLVNNGKFSEALPMLRELSANMPTNQEVKNLLRLATENKPKTWLQKNVLYIAIGLVLIGVLGIALFFVLQPPTIGPVFAPIRSSNAYTTYESGDVALMESAKGDLVAFPITIDLAKVDKTDQYNPIIKQAFKTGTLTISFPYSGITPRSGNHTLFCVVTDKGFLSNDTTVRVEKMT
jgi:hypothetical protein